MNCLIQIDERYFRPNEIHYLKGDSSKAMRKLNWKCEITFKDMIKEMMEEELK